MPTDRERRPPGSRWWWLVVAALALVVAVLLVRGGGEEDDGVQATVPETPELQPAGPGTQAERGSLTAGGDELLPLPADGDLSGWVGDEVVGNDVPVDSIVAEGVFWVGDERDAVLLVQPEGAEPQVGEGDVVTFRGTMRALDDEVRAAIFGADEQRLERQGAYVDVADLERAGG